MATDKAPAFQFYAKEWITDTREFSSATKGILADCMALCWENGSVPADPVTLARAVGATAAEIAEAWPLIDPTCEGSKFSPDPTRTGRLIYRRLEVERAKQAEYRAEQAEKGKAGAAARERNRHPNQAAASTAAKPVHEPRHQPGPIPDGNRNQALQFPISDLQSPISDPDRTSEPPAGAGDPLAPAPPAPPAAPAPPAPPPRPALPVVPPWRMGIQERWTRVSGIPAGESMMGVPGLLDFADLIGSVALETGREAGELFDLAVAKFLIYRSGCSPGRAPRLTPLGLISAWSDVWQLIAGTAPAGRIDEPKPGGIIGPMGPTVKHVGGRTPRKAYGT